MRLLPIIAAATIGLFATAAVAQNMNTKDPNSAPGVSSTGGKKSGPVNRANTADPNSAPRASTTGRAASGPNAAEVKKMDTTDPNSTPGTAMAKSKKHKKRHM
jgi:hypothetical protein